jgi:hypothetical protein
MGGNEIMAAASVEEDILLLLCLCKVEEEVEGREKEAGR